MKSCCRCNETKPYPEFNRRARTADGYDSRCRQCQREYQSDYMRRNPVKARERNERKRQWQRDYDKKTAKKRRLVRHHISAERYEVLLREQGGVCAICAQVPELNFRIDHDHACCPGPYSCGRCIRGLLCHLCNLGLGAFGERLENVEGAVRYLKRV